MISAVKKFEFCYGHRLYNHSGKCANIHGHNAIVYCYVRSKDVLNPLNEEGMIVDFSIIKERLGGWINENWDHKFLYFSDDEFASKIAEYLPSNTKYVLECNPTAENLADFLRILCAGLFRDIEDLDIYRIDFYETPTSFAISEKKG